MKVTNLFKNQIFELDKEEPDIETLKYQVISLIICKKENIDLIPLLDESDTIV